MRIFKSNTDQQAVRFPRPADGIACYQLLPSNRARDVNGRKLNTNAVSVFVPTVEVAARYLIDDPGSSIRMMPGHAIIKNDIVIGLMQAEPPPEAAQAQEADPGEEEME